MQNALIHNISNLVASSLVLVMLSACGGGSDSKSSAGDTAVQPTPVIYTGRFVDAPVAGLTYTTASRSGTTDANGYFMYSDPGEEIRFSIGALQIGQAKATSQVHVYDLNGSLDDQVVGRNVRIAQLLQSLDQNAGKTAVIQIPTSAAAQLTDSATLNLSGSQATYDSALRKLLSSIESGAQLVSRESAKASANANVAELITKCPLSLPNSPDSLNVTYRIVTGNLTCMDIAKINYYQLRIAPLLYSQINSGQAQATLVQEAWSEETAQALIDKNPIIALLQTVDSVVEAVEPANQANAASQSVALSKVFISAAQSMTKLLVTFDEPDGSAGKDADLSRKNLELSTKLLDVLGGSASCVAYPKTRNDADANSCLKAIADGLSAIQKGYDLPSFKLNDAADQAKLKAELKYIADIFAQANATLKFTSQLDQGGDKLRRASFGLAGASIKTVRDSISLVYASRGQSIPNTGWVAVTTGLLDNVAAPIAAIGKNCWGVSKLEPGNYAKCLSSGAQELIKVSLTASVALIGSVETVRSVGTINEAVVAQAMIEEVLWAGSSNFDSVFAKYGVAVSNNPYGLVEAVGKNKLGLNGVRTYADMFSLIWAATWKGQNSYNVPDTMSLVGSYLSLINQNTTPDFSSPSILLASESGDSGVVNVRVIVTPEKNGFTNGKVVCFSEGSLDHSGDAPWQGDIKGVTTQTFSLSYGSAGSRVLMCSLFTASRLFVGSKATVVVAVLPLAPASSIITATPSHALVGSVVDFVVSKFQAAAKVVWDFGIEAASMVKEVIDGVSSKVSATFTTIGVKNVTATFKDGDNLVLGQSTTTVAVSAAVFSGTTITGAVSDSSNQPGPVANNGTTDDTTPMLSGTISAALTSGQKVNVYDGNNQFTPTAVVSGTNWTFTPPTPLIGGVHSFTAEVAAFDGTPANARSAAYVVNVSSTSLTSIAPSEIVRTLAGSFAIVGRDLPTGGVSVTVPGDAKASCQVPNNMSASGFDVACQFYKLGAQTLEIRTATTLLGIASVMVKTNITGVTWTSPSTTSSGTVKFGETVAFSVAGVNMLADPIMGFAVQLCGVSNTEIGAPSNTLRTFSCNFNNTAGAVAGQMPGVVKDAPGGQVLFDGWNVPVEVPVAPPTASGKLPDTGITASQCYGAGSNALVSCTSAAAVALNSQQDGMVGRDVANNDNADGKAGFSYTKIGANGETLPANATAWSCVKDNITGLMWEVKTADGGLRDWTKTYTNYDSTTSRQLVDGTAPTQAQIDAATNSVGFKNAVNTAGLCGASDWRLPTPDDLQGIVDYGVGYPGPTIDATWFPKTQGHTFWSSSPYVGSASDAWFVSFYSGGVSSPYGRYNTVYVRLVRDGQ